MILKNKISGKMRKFRFLYSFIKYMLSQIQMRPSVELRAKTEGKKHLQL